MLHLTTGKSFIIPNTQDPLFQHVMVPHAAYDGKGVILFSERHLSKWSLGFMYVIFERIL